MSRVVSTVSRPSGIEWVVQLGKLLVLTVVPIGALALLCMSVETPRNSCCHCGPEYQARMERETEREEAMYRFLPQLLLMRALAPDGVERERSTESVMRAIAAMPVGIEVDELDWHYPSRALRALTSDYERNLFAAYLHPAPAHPRCLEGMRTDRTMSSTLTLALKHRQSLPDGADRAAVTAEILAEVEATCGAALPGWCLDEVWYPRELQDVVMVGCAPL